MSGLETPHFQMGTRITVAYGPTTLKTWIFKEMFTKPRSTAQRALFLVETRF